MLRNNRLFIKGNFSTKRPGSTKPVFALSMCLIQNRSNKQVQYPCQMPIQCSSRSEGCKCATLGQICNLHAYIRMTRVANAQDWAKFATLCTFQHAITIAATLLPGVFYRWVFVNIYLLVAGLQI